MGLRIVNATEAFNPQAGRHETDDSSSQPWTGSRSLIPRNSGRPVLPAANIERVGIDGRSFDLTSAIQASPGKGQLQIEFSAPALKSPHKIRFRYKLEGFDKEWVEAGERRTAYYTNIPPGIISSELPSARLTAIGTPMPLPFPLLLRRISIRQSCFWDFVDSWWLA